MSLLFHTNHQRGKKRKKKKKIQSAKCGTERFPTFSKISKASGFQNEYKKIHIFRLEEGQESCWEKILFFSFALPVYATHDTGAKHFSNSPQTHGRRRPLTPHELDRLTELGSNNKAVDVWGSMFL